MNIIKFIKRVIANLKPEKSTPEQLAFDAMCESLKGKQFSRTGYQGYVSGGDYGYAVFSGRFATDEDFKKAFH